MRKLVDHIFKNVNIAVGVNTTPALLVPSTAKGFELTIARDNWPPEGADIELDASYDNGASWIAEQGPLHIDAYIPTPKEPGILPAVIGWGWGDRPEAPTHVRGSLTTLTAFQTSITVTVDGQ